MKNLKNQVWVLIAGIAALSLFAGCKPPAKDGARVYTTQRTDVGNVNTGGSVFSSTCSTGQSAVGTIYDATFSSTTSFENRVKLFLSATTLPEDIGTISSGPSDSTGVRFQGVIKLDQSGNVVLNQSRIAIKVYDSFVNGDMQPIPVNINSAFSGQFNLQTGQGSIVFKDSYGEIRFDGIIDSQYFRGNISYTNYTTVVSGSSPASGPLGQFYIATCGVIQ